jgi:hypothetical protein
MPTHRTTVPEIQRSLVLSTAHLRREDRDLLQAMSRLALVDVLASLELPKSVAIALRAAIPDADRTDTEDLSLVVEPREYGYQVFIPDEHDDRSDIGQLQDRAPSIVAAIRLAQKEACQWVVWDCDGDTLDEATLPTYRW